ncbi:MAG: RNB domain-containing ribonuclease [Planctomycetota bacterium]|nr:RNB domain-containing ribonuclease [Planctomycetota bacterium]
MREREILIFRYRKGLRTGVLQEGLDDKLRVACEKNRSFLIPRENVLLSTEVVAASQGELDSFVESVEALAARIDLEEVWELVRGDGEALGFRDLTELSVDGPPDARSYAAVLWHLNRPDCLHFQSQGELYLPSSAEAVEEKRRRGERQRREREEDRAFLDWLSAAREGPTPEAMSDRQRDWLQKVRDFVVHGDEWGQASRVKKFLSGLADCKGNPRRALHRLLVERGVLDANEHLDLLRLSVPLGFSSEAEAEAAAFEPAAATADGRRDLTDLRVFSVDDESTTDLDDAFSLERTAGGYLLGIHITDLSGAVRPGSSLDEEARSRATSLYFPERKIPMLPRCLSEGSGSLLPGRERLALTLLVELGPSLETRAADLVPSVIASHHRLSYDEVNRVLDGEEHPLAEDLRTLGRYSEELRNRRRRAGAPELDRPELEVRVTEAGEVSVAVRPRETAADRLVSELMILYNVETARFFRDRNVPAIFRGQEASAYDLESSTVHPAVGRHEFLRGLPPPAISLEPCPHRVLGVDLYSQTSSPLRRYFDLLLQRQLAVFLREGHPAHGSDEVSAILHEANERLRELRRLEPERRSYWLLEHLRQRGDEPLTGVVLEASGRRGFVELVDYAVRGSVALHSEVTPGDEVRVRPAPSEPWDSTLRFVQA